MELILTSKTSELNHMIKQNVFFLSIVLILFTLSCNKKDECVAGTGGAVTIAAFPQHHTKPINGQQGYVDSAFVKFNSQSYPGPNPSDYDLVIAGEVGEDHVHIPNLKCGDYFIYMTGWDSSINERVKGGIPYSFTETSGELDLNVPVTED